MRFLAFLLAAAVDAGTVAKPAAPPPDAGQYVIAPMAPEVKTLVDRVQDFYEKTQDFQGGFTQTYRYKMFKREQVSTGTVTFKKPALMRWEYEKPAKKTFLLAGDNVMAFDPEAQTVTKALMSTDKLSAAVTFLMGKGKLANEFKIQKLACDKCTGTLLELIPIAPDPRFQKVLLEVDPKSAQVVRSTVVDPNGDENQIAFSELKTNTGVKEDFFKISLPKGTQILDYTKGAQPSKPSVDGGR